ncbi:mechanosensitive ion channel MscS-like protein [Artemisia annua]|uniref:Mechanosensitive ion channel protein n=1 Tax=Artemisia annua TaxID=35608 RepID=A0A2U1N2X9_ARTAN|nr:mechanosensitive ion channel MscS-like protein [Artemisia annua]
MSDPTMLHTEFQESPNNFGQVTLKEIRVSLDEVSEPRPSNATARSSGFGRSGEHIVVGSPNSHFKRKSTLMRMKTKSRLMGQQEIHIKPSHNTPKYETQGKGFGDIEEDEFSVVEDLPDEYKQLRYSKWTLLQLTGLVFIISALIFTLVTPKLKIKKFYDLEWWKWEVMIFAIICGRLVSGWGIRVLVFFTERSFLLRKRVLYFVYGLKSAVQNCIWLGLVLLAWQIIFDKKVERTIYGKKVLPYVTRIWICLLVGTLVWLLKTLIIKVLASNFHVSKFFDRIQDSLFNQYVIERLSGRPVIEIQKEQEEKDWMMEEVEKLQSDGANIPYQLNENIVKGFRGIGGSRPSTPLTGKKEANSPPKKHDSGITIDHLHKFNQKNVSAWNMNRMMNVINTSMLTISDEQFLDMTGYGYGDGDSDDDENSKQINSENQAKYASKKIFFNVAQQGSKYIYLEDLMRFLRDDEALRTIRLFHEASATKGISKRDLKHWVVNVFRERRALALSLNDTKTAVHKLHQMLNIVVAIIIVIIWLLILKLLTTHFFIFLSSQLILIAFVFGNTCKTLFEAIIFLFIMHPFDVGDRCEIDGVQMIVEEMNILTTTFLRYDNQKIAYPNSVLSTMPIGNYQRSPDMGDAIDFCIHVSTPAGKIANMKERITSYVENKSDHWQPEPMIVVRDVEEMNRLKISIWLTHRSNFQDMGGRWKRRALLVEKMIKILKDLDIEYRMLPLDINVRNIPPLSSNRLPSNWTVCAN